MNSKTADLNKIKKQRTYEFSEKEKLVLYALARCPLKSDIEISKKINIKRSTFTAIKKRLRERDMYKLIYIFGCRYMNKEIFNCTFFQINAKADINDLKDFKNAVFKNHSSSIYNIATDTICLDFSILRDLAQLKKNMFHFEENGRSKKIFENNHPEYITFSFRHSNIFLDYAPMIKKIFNLDIEDDICYVKPIEDYAVKDRKILKQELSKNEAKVIDMLLKYPEKKDISLAGETGLNIQTFRKIKTSLLNQKILIPLVLPNLDKLNKEILVFKKYKFDHLVPISEWLKLLRFVDLNYSCNVFRVYDENDCISLSVYDNYTSYQKKMNELYEHMVQEGLKIIEPVTMIIPIKNIKSIKNMDTLGIFKENFDVR